MLLMFDDTILDAYVWYILGGFILAILIMYWWLDHRRKNGQ